MAIRSGGATRPTTIVGVFRHSDEARRVLQRLTSAGFGRGQLVVLTRRGLGLRQHHRRWIAGLLALAAVGGALWGAGHLVPTPALAALPASADRLSRPLAVEWGLVGAGLALLALAGLLRWRGRLWPRRPALARSPAGEPVLLMVDAVTANQTALAKGILRAGGGMAVMAYSGAPPDLHAPPAGARPEAPPSTRSKGSEA